MISVIPDLDDPDSIEIRPRDGAAAFVRQASLIAPSVAISENWYKGVPVNEISTSRTGGSDEIFIWEIFMVLGTVLACLGPLAIYFLLYNNYFEDQITKHSAELFSRFASWCAIWFGFAAFYFTQTRWNMARARAAAAWPTAPGVVERSEVKRARGMYTGGYGYDLLYRYQVCDRNYECCRIQFGPKSFAKMDTPARLVENYPMGTSVQVYYNPDAPDVAVLETSAELAQRQSRWWFWISLAMPFILTLPFVG